MLEWVKSVAKSFNLSPNSADFVKVQNMTYHNRRGDAEPSRYATSATRRIFLYGLELSHEIQILDCFESWPEILILSSSNLFFTYLPTRILVLDMTQS